MLARRESLTEAERGPQAVLATLTRVISDLSAGSDAIRAIGIACAGQIHPETQAVVFAPNLRWENVPLRAEIAQALRAPVWVDNDVRAAAWGEFRFGAGARSSSLVAVFVGTGVGSGAVLEGALWRGAGNAAGEVGHTQIVADGLLCPCGQRGCMEQYASGSGLQRRFATGLERGVPTSLRAATGADPARLTARLVFEAAAVGDAYARELWGDLERSLTLSLANYVTLVNPEVLVLGGGVIETVPALFDAVAAGVSRFTTAMARFVLRVRRAALGDWSGVVGAADLARLAP